MLKRLAFLIFFGTVAHLLQASLTDEEIILLMDEKPVEGYDINPLEHGLEASSSGFIILNYDDAVIEGIWRILDNPEQQEHWKPVYRSLRRIATADPTSIDYDRLIRQIRSVEESESIENEDKVDLLMLGYSAVARHRDDQAFEFLKARTKFDFWEDNDISQTVYNSHGAGSEGILQTAQGEAISALDELQTEQAYALMQSLLADESYSSKYHLDLVLRGSLEYGGWEASASRLQTVQAEYAKRLELRGESAPVQLVEEPTVDILPVAPEVIEVVEEVTEPEPVTEEEPAEVVITELIKEDVEQSSNWWLWLIGAVVVVGGVFVLRSKK